MIIIEKNDALTLSLVIFAAVIFAYRIWDVFIKKYSQKEKIYYPWTLIILSILHTLVGIFSVLEYVTIVRKYNLLIGCLSFAVFLFGQGLRNLAIATLGKYHSPHIEIKNDHQLINKQVYAYLRNPYYVGVILEVGSTPLIFNAYYAFLIFLFLYFPILLVRMFLEDKVLYRVFGDSYLLYKKKVPGFFPRLRRK